MKNINYNIKNLEKSCDMYGVEVGSYFTNDDMNELLSKYTEYWERNYCFTGDSEIDAESFIEEIIDIMKFIHTGKCEQNMLTITEIKNLIDKNIIQVENFKEALKISMIEK